MDIQVQIDKEAIQQQIVQAIVASSIGEHIKKAIETSLTKTHPQGNFGPYRTIIEAAVDDAVRVQIYQYARELIEEKKESIRQQMQDKLTDEVLAAMGDAAWSIMTGKLEVSR